MRKKKKNKGGRKMEQRRVIKIRNSLYVCLPGEMCELWGIEKGDYLTCLYLPGYGILMTRGMDLEKLPFQEARVVRMKQLMDNLFYELRKKAKAVEQSFVGKLYQGLIFRAEKDGLVKITPQERHRMEAARLTGFVDGQFKKEAQLGEKVGLLESKVERMEKVVEELRRMER